MHAHMHTYACMRARTHMHVHKHDVVRQMLQCWAKKCSADTLLNSELDDLLAENTDDGAGWDCG